MQELAFKTQQPWLPLGLMTCLPELSVYQEHSGHDFCGRFPRFTSLKWFTVEQLIMSWVSMSGGLEMHVHVCVCAVKIDGFSFRWSFSCASVGLLFDLLPLWCKHLPLWTDRYQIEQSIYKTRHAFSKKYHCLGYTSILFKVFHLFSIAWYTDVLTAPLCEICSSLRKSLIARNKNA